MRHSPAVLGLVFLSLAGLGLGPIAKPAAPAPTGAGAEATPVPLGRLLTRIRHAAARGSDAMGTVIADVDGMSLDVQHDHATPGLLEASDDGEIFRVFAGQRLGRPSEFSVALFLEHGDGGWQLRGAEVHLRGEVYRAAQGTVQIGSYAGGTLVGRFHFVASRVDAPSETIEVTSGKLRVTPNH